MRPARCAVCGATGSYDTTASYRRQGRRNQGAMTPQWGPTEWSPYIGLEVCPAHFRALFYRLTAAERAGDDVTAYRDELVVRLRRALL